MFEKYENRMLFLLRKMTPPANLKQEREEGITPLSFLRLFEKTGDNKSINW